MISNIKQRQHNRKFKILSHIYEEDSMLEEQVFQHKFCLTQAQLCAIV